MRVALCFVLRNPSLKASAYWERWLRHAGSERFELFYHCDHSDQAPTPPLDQATRAQNSKVETRWGNYGVVQAEASLYRSAFEKDEIKYAVLLTDWCVPIYAPDATFAIMARMKKPWICWDRNTKAAELQKIMSRELAPEWLSISACPPSEAEVEEANRISNRVQSCKDSGINCTYASLDDQNHDEAHVVRRIIDLHGCDWLIARAECRPVTLSVFLEKYSCRALRIDLKKYNDAMLRDACTLFVRKVSDKVPSHMPLQCTSSLAPKVQLYPDNFSDALALLGGHVQCGPSSINEAPPRDGCMLIPCSEDGALEIAQRAQELRLRGWRLLSCNAATIGLFADKWSMVCYAKAVGMAHNLPRVYDTPRGAQYPCIFKTRRGAFGDGVRIVHSPSDIAEDEMHRGVLQELIPGREELCASLIVISGQIRHALQTRYVYTRDIYVHPFVKERIGQRRVRHSLTRNEHSVFSRILCDFTGVCNVNYKMQRGIIKIFEVNPRLGADVVYGRPEHSRVFLQNLNELMC